MTVSTRKTGVVRLDTLRQKVRLGLGLLVCVAIVAGFVYAGLVTADSSAKQVGAFVVAGLFVLFTVGIGSGGWLAVRKQALVFTTEGVRRQVGLGANAKVRWTVPWSQLRSAGVHRGYQRLRGSSWSGRTWTVWLELEPLDSAGDADRPGLAQFRGLIGVDPGTYAVWLGPPTELVAPIDEAARPVAGAVWQGIVEEGDLHDRPTFVRRRRRKR